MNSEITELIYYSVWLIFLSGFIFYSSKKERLKKIQYLAIWLLIFFGIFVFYSYKNILFNNRITAHFNIAAGVNSKQKITYFVAEDNHFYIDANLNGEKIRFLVDTGATDITLTLNDAKKIGLEVDKLHYNRGFYTANGIIYAATAKVASLKVKDLYFEDIYVSVNPNDLGVSLLGMKFLTLFNKYEFSSDTLILYK